MLYRNVIARLALHGGIVVIKIVNLELNRLNKGLFGKNHIKNIGGIVEGHCDMLNPALLLKPSYNFKGVTPLVLFVKLAVKAMEKVKIKIIHAAELKLIFKKGQNILLLFKIGV